MCQKSVERKPSGVLSKSPGCSSAGRARRSGRRGRRFKSDHPDTQYKKAFLEIPRRLLRKTRNHLQLAFLLLLGKEFRNSLLILAAVLATALGMSVSSCLPSIFIAVRLLRSLASLCSQPTFVDSFLMMYKVRL